LPRKEKQKSEEDGEQGEGDTKEAEEDGEQGEGDTKEAEEDGELTLAEE
jgi:hypothetical protein